MKVRLTYEIDFIYDINDDYIIDEVVRERANEIKDNENREDVIEDILCEYADEIAYNMFSQETWEETGRRIEEMTLIDNSICDDDNIEDMVDSVKEAIRDEQETKEEVAEEE